jgi:hypothetical protein
VCVSAVEHLPRGTLPRVVSIKHRRASFARETLSLNERICLANRELTEYDLSIRHPRRVPFHRKPGVCLPLFGAISRRESRAATSLTLSRRLYVWLTPHHHGATGKSIFRDESRQCETSGNSRNRANRRLPDTPDALSPCCVALSPEIWCVTVRGRRDRAASRRRSIAHASLRSTFTLILM